MRYIKSTLLCLAISTAFVNAQISRDNLSPYTNYIIDNLSSSNLSKTSLSQGVDIIAADKFSCYITISDNSVIDKLVNLGVDVNTTVGNIITAKVPIDSIDSILELNDVLDIYAAVDVFPTMDIARPEIGATKVEEGIDIAVGYSGKGVVVGIVDIGAQLDHIEFLDQDGNLRIKRVWVQTDNSGTPPDGYSYGTEYVTASEISALKYDTTSGTHGNHVMSTAAGGYTDGDLYGVATESDIVYVSYDSETTSISDALQYIYNYADEVGKPAVINTSIGAFVGARDGKSSYDVIVDQLVGEGKILVGAAGNSGDGDRHISKEITSTTDTLKTFTNFDYTLTYNNQTVIYGADLSPVKFKLSIYDKVAARDYAEIPLLSTSQSATYTLNFTDKIIGQVYLYLGYESSSQRSCIYLSKDITYCDPDYTMSLTIIGDEGKTVHAWDKYDTFVSNGISGFSGGDNNYSILEIGGTANRIITVGAYTTDSRNTSVLGDILSESGRGPTVDNRVKPEVTAPGNVITAAYSNSSEIINSAYYQQYMDLDRTVSKGGEDYYYGYMSGTSMASPIVTGAVAIWLQARPSLTPEEVKEIIQETSRTDSFTGDLDVASNTWGYGKIDVWSGLKECLELNGIENSTETGVDAVLFNYSSASKVIRFMVSQPTNKVDINIYTTNGVLVKTNSYTNLEIGAEEQININALSDGVYIVRVSADSYTNSIKVIK